MRNIFVLLWVFLILILLCGCISPPKSDNLSINKSVNNSANIVIPKTPQGPYPLSLNASLLAYPEKIMVYQTIPEDPVKKLSYLAQIFNITGDVNNDSVSLRISDSIDNRQLTVFKDSGAFIYADSERWMKSDPKDIPELVPTDENAIAVAEAYLKSKGLWPNDAVFSGVGEGIGSNHKQVEVSFNHIANSMPINREKITVSVGGGGDIIGVQGVWRDYKIYKEYPLITPTRAYEELQKNNKTGIITNVSLQYDAGDPWKDPVYLTPVYLFQGTDYDLLNGPYNMRYEVIATPSLGQYGLIQP